MARPLASSPPGSPPTASSLSPFHSNPPDSPSQLPVIKLKQSRRGGRVVDGTGLENRRTRKGIGGSNPSLSARQSGVQRNCASVFPTIRELCPFFAIYSP